MLSFAVDKGMKTKTGMMVGLGETNDEILKPWNSCKFRGINFYYRTISSTNEKSYSVIGM